MRYLITGGSGFIGRYFHEMLSARGHDLVILDLVRPEWDIGAARFVHGDVRDPHAVERAVRDAQRVLHLAAAHHDFGISEKTYYDVNERGSRVLCDAMDTHGIRDACFYSSVAVFGDAPEPHTESAPTKPNSPYGGSKLAGERVFESWTKKGEGRRCLVIRPTVTFGPRNFANMYSLIRQIAGGKFVQVGDGSNIKSLSYVENIVECTAHVWDVPDRPAFDIVQYIDKPDLTSRQIAAQIYTSLGKRVPGFRVPLWAACLAALPFDVVIKLTGRNLPVSSARIKKLFATQTKFEAEKVALYGFKARHTVGEGIDRMVKWYVAEGRNQQAVWHQPPEHVVTSPVAA